MLSEDEAKEKIKIEEEQMLAKFCPQIRSLCKSNCASFRKGKLHQYQNGFHVSSPYCSCPTVTGFMEIDS